MPIEFDGIINAPGQETDGADLFFEHFKKQIDASQDAGKRLSEPEVDEETQLRQRMLKRLDPADEDQPTRKEPPVEDEETPPSEVEAKQEGDEDPDAHLYLEDEKNVYTKVKVGEEEHEVSLESLKRLHGQEAALTQRSQQLAESRRMLEQREATHLTANTALLDHFRKQLQPYMGLDFVALARDRSVNQQEVAIAQQQAKNLYDTVQFLEHQQNDLMQKVRERQDAEMQQGAIRCVQELRDPASPHYIDGWSPQMYDDLRSFGISQGLHKDLVNSIVDPAALKIMRMAQLYQAGKKAMVQTTKVNKTVTKVVKSTRALPASAKGPGGEKAKALARLQRTGDVDDAANAFFAGFKEYIDQ